MLCGIGIDGNFLVLWSFVGRVFCEPKVCAEHEEVVCVVYMRLMRRVVVSELRVGVL